MIKYLLDNRLKIEIVDECNSSQDRLKYFIKNGSDIDAVLALSQSKGRGQKDKSFYSPKDGFYFSLRLRANDFIKENLAYLTLFCGNVVRMAIKDLFSIDCEIKFVNDLYYKDRKVCGILVESLSKSREISDFIVGIGINLKDDKNLPSDIRDIYGSLGLSGDFKKISYDLIAYISSRLLDFGSYFDRKVLIDDINKNLYKKNTPISIKKGTKTYKGILMAIDYNLNIILKRDERSLSINGHNVRLIL